MSELATTPLHLFPGVRRVVPQRYIWHVGYGSTPETLASIQRYGLMAGFSKYNCVFANNQSVDLEYFYPYMLYALCKAYSYGGEYTAPDHDIWRIDTSMCNAQWYTDPNMIEQFPKDVELHTMYLATRQNIPPQALRRYRALPDREPRYVVKHGDGVSSCCGPRLGIAPFPWREDPRQLVSERAA